MAASTSTWILLLLALLVSTFIATVSAGNEIYESRGIKSVNGGGNKYQMIEDIKYLTMIYGFQINDHFSWAADTDGHNLI